jgi:hypothetical protein
MVPVIREFYGEEGTCWAWTKRNNHSDIDKISGREDRTPHIQSP